jgi:hypothetical protein
VTPRLQRDRAFGIGKLSSPSRPLVNHVRQVPDLLFEGTAPATEQFVRLDCSYEQDAWLPAAIAPILLGFPRN